MAALEPDRPRAGAHLAPQASSHRGLGIAAVLAGIIASSCGAPKFANEARKDNVFRLPIDVPMTSLDPALVSDSWSIDTLQNSFEGLVAMGEDNRVHPCLAKRWSIGRDGRTYTFQLEPGVLFQNGKTCTARDVRASFERACSSQLAAPLASDYLNDIAGMAAFREGRAPRLSGIKVIDDHTISITLDAPHPYFLAKLSLPIASVVDVQSIHDRIHIRSVEEMIGTGPFRITKYVDGQEVVQTAFRGYHGAAPKIDEIDRPVMRDAASRLEAFQRGEIDAVQQLSRADYLALKQDPHFRDEVRLVPRATLTYFAINCRLFPDRRIRQAIAMAIDRERIASDTMYGTVTPARGFLPPSVPGYRRQPDWLAPNIGRAQQLLAESGHAGGKGLPELHLAFAMENPDIGRIADAVAAQLKQGLGLTVRLDKMDSATLISRQSRNALESVVTGWFADYVDPEDFLSILLTTSSPENHWNYSNPRYDALCGQADRCPDPQERLTLYAKAEDLGLQDAPIVPLSYWQTPVIVSRRVHGLRSYAGQWLPYNSVSLDH